MNWRDRAGLLRRTVAYFKDPRVLVWRKLLGLVAVVYVALPFDVIPDFIPVVGWLDDLGLLGAVAWFLIRDIQRHGSTEVTVDGSRKPRKS